MRTALLLAALLLCGCAAPPPGSSPLPGPAGAPSAPGAPAQPGRFLHEHAAWAMFLLGERVAFTDAAYDLSRIGNLSAHLHVAEPDGGSIVHIEGNFSGGVPDVTLQSFLRTLGVRFDGANLTLDTRDHHNGTAWNGTAQRRWQVLVANTTSGRTTWSEAAPGALLPLRDGTRLLLTYGADPEQLAAQEQAVPVPPARAPAPSTQPGPA